MPSSHFGFLMPMKMKIPKDNVNSGSQNPPPLDLSLDLSHDPFSCPHQSSGLPTAFLTLSLSHKTSLIIEIIEHFIIKAHQSFVYYICMSAKKKPYGSHCVSILSKR